MRSALFFSSEFKFVKNFKQTTETRHKTRQVFSATLAADLQSIATFFCFPRGRFPLYRNNRYTIDNEFLGAFTKFQEPTIRFVVSVRPYETTRSPMDKFS